uniref:CCHC-type domain-containing protein n=1 Tax=Spongospora subterranea TaxID=70186 RepID=A0A0H5RH58_9EUKA|eukprot:CRZ08019.1 hypothetical protein [Spongospora subterranea]
MAIQGWKGKQPDKATQIGSNTTMFQFQMASDAKQCLSQGTVHIFGKQYKPLAFQKKEIRVCETCYQIECLQKNKCGKIACYICSEAHMADSCPKKNKDEPKCITCQEEGHWAIQCPWRYTESRSYDMLKEYTKTGRLWFVSLYRKAKILYCTPKLDAVPCDNQFFASLDTVAETAKDSIHHAWWR